MKRTIAKLASAALIATTVLGVSATPADACNNCKTTVLPNGIIQEEHEGCFWETDEEEREAHTVDLTDPAMMEWILRHSPNATAGTNKYFDPAEEAQYEELLRKNRIWRENRESATGNADSQHARLLLFRDAEMTDRYASVKDIAVGDTVYYKVETDEGYVCTYIDINCPLNSYDNTIYADIPGSGIGFRLETWLIGDINNDGVLNAADISAYMKDMVRTDKHWPENVMLIDVNADGKDNARDLTALMQRILGNGKLKSNRSYYHRKYLKAFTVSVRPEGSDEVYEAPLPAPLPTMELSEDKNSVIDYGIDWKGLDDDRLPENNPYLGVSSEFWRGYTFVEMEMDIVEGDTLSDLRIEDPNGPYSGVPIPWILHYSIPEGAKTVKATVRIAYLTDPGAQDR